jgi:hypothetical protein
MPSLGLQGRTVNSPSFGATIVPRALSVSTKTTQEPAAMASDPKAPPLAGTTGPAREKGVRIFTYPKIIFIFPTLIMSLICWIGMYTVHKSSVDFNYQRAHPEIYKTKAKSADAATPVVAANGESYLPAPDPAAFDRRENVLGLLFLMILFLNLMILAFDFPRFAIFAFFLAGTTVLFFFLWLGFGFLAPLRRIVEGLYVVANAEFYLLFSMVLLAIYGFVFLTRWLDYWEILPNEILHHHGPLSDLERYPTMNLKFDKEIPDVFEHMMFGAGRLVLHVSSEAKPLVLDTVLNVSRKEEALKKLMSRLEVRVTTDQEVASP